MSNITVEELLEKGYKEFPANPIFTKINTPCRFFQKKIVFSEDEELFIDLYIYDLSKLSSAESLTYQFSTQINTEYIGTTFNVETVGWNDDEVTLDQVEDLFIEIYEVGKSRRKLKGKD